MNVKKHNNSGFTLVEVICAVTVLMLVVLPIFTGFVMAAKTNAAISEKLEINLILQNELEKVKVTGRIDDCYYDGHPTTVVLEKGDYGGNNSSGVMLPNGAGYTKMSSEIELKIEFEQVKVTTEEQKIAYYIITFTYDNETEDDKSDDVVLKGVYSPW